MIYIPAYPCSTAIKTFQVDLTRISKGEGVPACTIGLIIHEVYNIKGIKDGNQRLTKCTFLLYSKAYENALQDLWHQVIHQSVNRS